MMDKETLMWLQAYVSSGRGSLISRKVIEEIESQLTPAQIILIEDLPGAVNDAVSKTETDVKDFIDSIVGMAKAGVVSKRRR